MSLIKCRECKGNVSTKADSCPHCGCPMKRFGSDRKTEQALVVPAREDKAPIWLKIGLVIIILATTGFMAIIIRNIISSSSRDMAAVLPSDTGAYLSINYVDKMVRPIKDADIFKTVFDSGDTNIQERAFSLQEFLSAYSAAKLPPKTVKVATPR